MEEGEAGALEGINRSTNGDGGWNRYVDGGSTRQSGAQGVNGANRKGTWRAVDNNATDEPGYYLMDACTNWSCHVQLSHLHVIN